MENRQPTSLTCRNEAGGSCCVPPRLPPPNPRVPWLPPRPPKLIWLPPVSWLLAPLAAARDDPCCSRRCRAAAARSAKPGGGYWVVDQRV